MRWKPVALKWKKSSPLWLLRLGQKEFESANGTQNKRSMVEQVFRGQMWRDVTNTGQP